MAGRITVEKRGAIGFMIFDYPERRNAITLAMWQQIPLAAQQLAADDEVRVVILRGAGEQAFVAGADISEFERSRTSENVDEYERDNARAFAALSAIDKPVIAMVHGFCVGGGVAIAICADLRYAASDAVFGVPAAKLGLGYAMAGIETLTQIVGYSNAKEIFFTARRFPARRALRDGSAQRRVREVGARTRGALDRRGDREERAAHPAQREAERRRPAARSREARPRGDRARDPAVLRERRLPRGCRGVSREAGAAVHRALSDRRRRPLRRR